MGVRAVANFDRRYVPVVLAVLAGALLSIGAVLLVLAVEYRLAQKNFESDAKSYVARLDGEVRDSATLLRTVAVYVQTRREPIGSVDFERFTRGLHGTAVGWRDIGWAPRVEGRARAAFERRMRVDGIDPRYRIGERIAPGILAPAPARATYYPLVVVESRKREVLGYDLLGDPLRRAVVLRALQASGPVATPPTDIFTIGRRAGGMLAYIAVRRRDSRDVAGLVLGVFEIDPLLTAIARRQIGHDELNLTLSDSLGGKIVFGQPPASALRWTGSIAMIDRRWTAIVTPARPPRLLHRSANAAIIFAGALAMSVLVVVFALISVRRRIRLEALVKQIGEMARRDAVTDLPNRVYFRERLDDAVARVARGSPFAVLALDLDNFKVVNDTFGHATGDQLLAAVAERAALCLRQVDTLARLGGDEFAVIVADAANAGATAAVADRLIREIATPYVIGGNPIAIGVSIGIAMAHGASTADGLLSDADIALYEAKRTQAGTFRFYEPQLRLQIETKRLLELDLRRGLERDEFELYYQPIVHLRDRTAAGFEALVRWRHPERGLISPDDFIPLAETSGLIVPLGRWVLDTACRDAAGWPLPLKVAINVSPVQFKDDEALVESIDAALDATGLAPERLEVEITEAAVLGDAARTLAIVQALRARKISIAFDDFGTGFSSLSSVLRFPFDNIKIDRSFVSGIETSAEAAGIVRAVVNLGTNLGLETTGEGVETAAQLAPLREAGCTLAQGYLFGRPAPASTVPDVIAALARNAEAVAAGT